MDKPILEVCAGSYADCLAAAQGKANRVELNSALFLGGLSSSPAVCRLVKENTDLEVICMVRPRPGGFCYSKEESEEMLAEAKDFLEAGADGIAFGFLKPDHTIDLDQTKKMVDLIHQYPQAKAVFHRAIDVTSNLDQAIESLIQLGVNRILTSGQKPTALEGLKTIAKLQKKYQGQIEILPGSGISAQNVDRILKESNVFQVHSSCKSYKTDPTTTYQEVSYGYLPQPQMLQYEAVDVEKVKDLRQALDHFSSCL